MNPSQAKQIQNALDSLHDAVDDLLDDLENKELNSVPVDARRVKDATNAVRDISGAHIIPKLKELKNTGDVVALRAKTHDVKAVDAGNDEISQKQKMLKRL